MFKNVIVRRPSKSMVNGITSSPELGKPDYELALKQHDAYIDALGACGVKVTVLEALEEYPDSCFVEDTAVLTPKCAIITNPGALSRRGESALMVETIRKFYRDDQIENITSPGTIEGGDVMMVGNHFYVGLSARTNEDGYKQFKEALEKYGHTCSLVPLEKVLHLKTGVNYIENNNMLVAGEFIEKEDFKSFNKIIVPENEAYGANCIWVNGKVIVPKGYPTVEKCIRELGYDVILIDTSEYRKLDGGLSCLSLRF